MTEPTAKDRANKARRLIAKAYDRHDLPTSVADALADLMHLRGELGICMADQHDRARRHYLAERMTRTA